METVEVIAKTPDTALFEVDSVPTAEHARRISRAGIYNATSNIVLATVFFVGVIPGGGPYSLGAADIIWRIGAALMGIFSLVRLPPKTSLVNVCSIAATAGMMLIPALIKWAPPSSGWLRDLGIVIELAGMTFTQLARVYLGRSFGLLPANRGIVCKGPFRLMRHPIYLGWLLLTVGYSISYPSARNVLVNIINLPFMMWRIDQEEAVLKVDPEYRAYCERVRYQLVPGVL